MEGEEVVISKPTGTLLVFIIFVLAAAASLQPARATDVCGAVCGETWTAAGSPYVVSCDVTVAWGCYLAIDAGVEVRFSASTSIVTNGTLDATGQAARPSASRPTPRPPPRATGEGWSWWAVP